MLALKKNKLLLKWIKIKTNQKIIIKKRIKKIKEYLEENAVSFPLK